MAEPSPADRMMQQWAERYVHLTPEEVAREARALVVDPQRGPLEGPYGPSGTGAVAVTASGRSPEAAKSEGPVRVLGPAGGGSDLSPGVSRSGRNVELGGSRVEIVEMTPEVLEEAARLLRVQREGVASRADGMVTAPRDGEATEQQGPTPASTRFGRPPPGYRPPQDGSREEGPTWPAAHALIRLLEQAPELVREALTSKSPAGKRARATVLQRLDDARLWLREALEVEEKEYQDRTVQ